MEEYRKKEKIVIQETLVEISCDICKKVIQNEQEISNIYRKGGHYYSVTIGHKDWGSDSGDSVETFEICSKECLRKHFENFIEEATSDTAHYKFEREPI